MAKADDEKPSIIIKRVKKVAGGHHGGAWKVAYADFVTAMMAFFLLLWLLSVTTESQKAQISAYFAPADPRVAQTMSGSGGVMGGTSMSTEGALTSERSTAVPNDPAEGVGKEDGEDGDKKAIDEKAESEEMDRQDKKSFVETEEKIRQAVEASPELKEIAQNLLIDQTPEGLRIQIVDQEGKPMFEMGSAKPLPLTEKLLTLITQAVKDLPNKLSIRGHTDSKPYGKDALYTNWELSSDRANASRRVMLAAALDGARIESVQGRADREALVPTDPASPRNRRISIIILKQSLVAGLKKPVVAKPASGVGKKLPPPPKKKEEGVIYFP